MYDTQEPSTRDYLESIRLEVDTCLSSLDLSIEHGDGLADYDPHLSATAKQFLDAMVVLNKRLDQVTKGQGLDRGEQL